MPNTYISLNQRFYIKNLAEELSSEWKCLRDVAADRISPRSDLKDKALSVIGAGLNGGATALSSIGVGMPITFAIKVVAIAGEHGGRFLRVLDEQDTISKMMAGSNFFDALHLLAEEVATEAAYQYEYALNYLISNQEGLICFARIGALRMIDYFIRNKCTSLTKENLLVGLIAGSSGAGIYSVTNNNIQGKDNKTYTAEDLYGRCAYRTSDGAFWINRDHGDLEITNRISRYAKKRMPNFLQLDPTGKMADSHFGWVQMQNNMPVNGYRWATHEEVTDLEYQAFPYAIPASLQQTSSWIFVNVFDFKNYMSARHKGYYGSFNDYMGATARFNGTLENIDLSGADFSYSDFTDAGFKNCNLNQCNFEHSFLTRSIWFNTSAKKLRAAHANMSYIKALDIDFENSDFSNTKFTNADIEGSNFTGCILPNLDNVIDTGIAKGGFYPPEARHLHHIYHNSNVPEIFQKLGAAIEAIVIQFYKTPTEIERNSAPYRHMDFCVLMLGNMSHGIFWSNDTFQYVILVKKDINLNANIAAAIKQVITEALEEIEQRYNIKWNLDAADPVMTIDTLVNSTINKDPFHHLQAQEAFYLGGNTALYTEYVNTIRKKNVSLLSLYQSLAELSNSTQPLFHKINEDAYQINRNALYPWLKSIYLLASHQKLTWDVPFTIIRRLVNKQVISNSTGILWQKFWNDTRKLRIAINKAQAQVLEHRFNLIVARWFDALKTAMITSEQFSLKNLNDVNKSTSINEIWDKIYASSQPSHNLICFFWAQVIENMQKSERPSEIVNQCIQYYKSCSQILKQTLLSIFDEMIKSKEATDLFMNLSNVEQTDGWFYAMHTEPEPWNESLAKNPVLGDDTRHVNLIVSEFAVVQLLRRLTGGDYWRQPPAEALALNDMNTWSNDQNVTNITDESIWAQFFADLILGVQYLSENDYFLVPTNKNDLSYHLNRVRLNGSFLKTESKVTTDRFGVHSTLKVQSLVLCLPQMSRPVHSYLGWVKRYIQLDIEKTLTSWLSTLSSNDVFFNKNNAIDELRQFLYPTLLLLQEKLKTGTTFIDLAFEINPNLAKYYKYGYQIIPNKKVLQQQPPTHPIRVMAEEKSRQTIQQLSSSSVTLVRYWYLKTNLDRTSISCNKKQSERTVGRVFGNGITSVLAIIAMPEARIARSAHFEPITIQDLTTGDTLSLNSQSTADTFTLLSDDSLISASREGIVSHWNLNTMKSNDLKISDSISVITTVNVGSGDRVAVGCYNGTIHLLQMGTGIVMTLSGHQNAISVLLKYFYNTLISGSDDGTIKCWNIYSGKETCTIQAHNGAVKSIGCLHDGRIISCSNDRTIKIWDPNTGELTRTWTNLQPINKLVVISEKYVATVSCAYKDDAVQIWDIATGEIVNTLNAPEDTRSLIISTNKQLIAASPSGQIYYWSEEEYTPKSTSSIKSIKL